MRFDPIGTSALRSEYPNRDRHPSILASAHPKREVRLGAIAMGRGWMEESRNDSRCDEETRKNEGMRIGEIYDSAVDKKDLPFMKDRISR